VTPSRRSKPLAGVSAPASAPAWIQDIVHLNRQIPPQAHTPMYVWHKYWSRKTWNVVQEHIKTYCPKGGIVFDPFAGSGVTALEALKVGRRAIACDLMPVATEISRLTLKPIQLFKLQEAFERVEKTVKNKILSLYETPCRRCKKRFPFTCAVWQKGKLKEIRYEACPYCKDRREKNTPLTKADSQLLSAIERSRIREWHPRNTLCYSDGTPFKKREKYASLDQLFTKRNLQALAWLMEAIEEALSAYARKVSGGEWMLRPEYSEKQIKRIHTRIIAILAEIGKRQAMAFGSAGESKAIRSAKGLTRARAIFETS